MDSKRSGKELYSKSFRFGSRIHLMKSPQRSIGMVEANLWFGTIREVPAMFSEVFYWREEKHICFGVKLNV